MPARLAKKATKKASARKATPRKTTRKSTTKRTRKPSAAGQPAAEYGGLSPMAVARGIGRYLEAVAAGGPAPTGRTPKDPKKILAFADKLEARSRQTPGVIQKLKLRNRIIQLRALADANGNGDSSRSFFVQHAGAYAKREGISYFAFRDVGVPAAVLKEAGVKQ